VAIADTCRGRGARERERERERVRVRVRKGGVRGGGGSGSEQESILRRNCFAETRIHFQMLYGCCLI